MSYEVKTGTREQVGKTESQDQTTVKKGQIKGKPVEAANGQTSKGWYILAIVIGAVVVLGAGGFGVTGAIHAAGVQFPSSLQWLAHAVSTVGNTGLWTIALGGAFVGGIIIAYGSYKLEKARQEEKVYQNEIETLRDQLDKDMSEQLGKQAKLAEEETLMEIDLRQRCKSAIEDQEYFQKMLGDNFSKVGKQAKSCKQPSQPNNTFNIWITGKFADPLTKKNYVEDTCENRFFVSIITPEGRELCSNRLIDSEVVKLKHFLERKGYKNILDASKKAEHVTKNNLDDEKAKVSDKVTLSKTKKPGITDRKSYDDLYIDRKVQVNKANLKKDHEFDLKIQDTLDELFFKKMIGDDFGRADTKPEWCRQKDQKPLTYVAFVKRSNNVEETRADRFYVTIITKDGKQQCSPRVTGEQQLRLVKILTDKKGYTQHVIKT